MLTDVVPIVVLPPLKSEAVTPYVYEVGQLATQLVAKGEGAFGVFKTLVARPPIVTGVVVG